MSSGKRLFGGAHTGDGPPLWCGFIVSGAGGGKAELAQLRFLWRERRLSLKVTPLFLGLATIDANYFF